MRGLGRFCLVLLSLIVARVAVAEESKVSSSTRTITIERRYLHLPVRTGADQTRMRLQVDGRDVRVFDIELAGDPGFWVFVDVATWKDRGMTLVAGPGLDGALSAIVQADEVLGQDEMYREPLRPRFHFTSRRGWLNDPNGLVYHDGEWHLYYQHNPYGWKWGNMHWGHAVSRDLLHWEEIGVVFVPWSDTVGMAYSGCAIVDRDNTAGFKSGPNDVIVAALTDTEAGEVIAWSNDHGRSFTMFDGNPVVRHAGRDPKIIWHEPTRRWVMAVYDEHEGKQWIAFHSSPDLKAWRFESRIEGFFECPDLFELPVDGDASNRRWVLYGGDARYVLGSFDGKRFTPEHEGKHQVWHGEFWAAQTFDNAPEGRRVQIGWARGVEMPGMPFNQQMAVPVELTLRQTEEGVRMFAEPVRELESLRKNPRHWNARTIRPGDENPLSGVVADATEIEAAMRGEGGGRVVFMLRGGRCVYDFATGELDCLGIKVNVKPVDGRFTLRFLLDRASVECFVNDGRVAISRHHLPPEGDTSIGIASEGASVRVESLDVYDLASVWE